MPKGMSDFSVVIAAYNEGSSLLMTMSAVASSLTGECNVEMVVVDDCSTDGSGEAASDFVDRLTDDRLSVKVVRTPGRSGTAAAKNFGQRHAQSPITVLLDAHSVPAIGALERLVEPLTRGDDSLAITGPTLASLPKPTAAEQLSGTRLGIEQEVLVHDTLAEGKLNFGMGQRVKDASMALEWAPPRLCPGMQRAQVICTCCIAIKTDSWGELPYEGLDTRFAFPYGLDEEISLRAWRLGLTVGLVPDAVVASDLGKAFAYGVPAHTSMYNNIRLAGLYFSADVVEKTMDHYKGTAGFTWVLSQLWLNPETAARRQQLDEMGPPELANLTPVVQEFGGLDVAVGAHRALMFDGLAEGGGVDVRSGSGRMFEEAERGLN